MAMTTEERIAQIAQGFNQGIQNFQAQRQQQQQSALAAEAKKRQEALQAINAASELSKQTGQTIMPEQVEPLLASGSFQGLGEILQSAPKSSTTLAAERKAQLDEKKTLAEIDKLNRAPKTKAPKSNQPQFVVGDDGQVRAATGKQLSAKDVATFNEGNAIPAMLKDIESVVSTQKDIFGPVQGRLASMNPYNERAQASDAAIRSASQAFGRFMEGGVLRKEDEEKYRKMFPNLGDTHETAKNKLAIVSRLLGQKQESTLKALGGAGYDVGSLSQGVSATPMPTVLTTPQAPGASLVTPAQAADDPEYQEYLMLLKKAGQ